MRRRWRERRSGPSYDAGLDQEVSSFSEDHDGQTDWLVDRLVGCLPVSVWLW